MNSLTFFWIKKLQDSKRQLASGALGDGALTGINRLSVEDLKYLFRMNEHEEDE